MPLRRLFLLSWLLLGMSARGIEFDSRFSDGMVIQRGEPVSVDGGGAAPGEVSVSLGTRTRRAAVAADGSWSVDFDPLEAGGPHSIRARDGSGEAVIEDVLVGDVWVFAGQSNMQMGLDEVVGGPAEIEAADPSLPVRLLTVPKAAAEQPQERLAAGWRQVSPDSLRKFSAVAWFFAKHLRQDPALAEVPLGLIDSSFGGTAIEGWTPAGMLPELPEEQLSASMFGIPPAQLFNGMIAPLCRYRVKGVAWYQGEANAGKPAVHAPLLGHLIGSWRREWKQPGLPFLVVQLPAFEGRMGGHDFSWLREAQAQACDRTDRAWLAVSYDTTRGFDLHPREKEEIGRRLSLLARREVYGRDLVARGPRMEGVAIEGGRVRVRFDRPVMVPGGERVRGFALAGDDGEFRHAEATIDGRVVTLVAPGVAAPRFVRHAWGAQPDANLTGGSGLPVAPFRSDEMAPDSVAFQPLPTAYRIETPTYALETGRGGSVSSLVVDGRQFLAHQPGGGTWVPGGFGPRHLAQLELAGPRRLTLADAEVELELACRDRSMTWTLTNRGKDPVELQIALAPQVEVAVDGRSATLARDRVRLEVEGLDRAEAGRLTLRAPGHGAATLTWTHSP